MKNSTKIKIMKGFATVGLDTIEVLPLAVLTSTILKQICTPYKVINVIGKCVVFGGYIGTCASLGPVNKKIVDCAYEDAELAAMMADAEKARETMKAVK